MRRLHLASLASFVLVVLLTLPAAHSQTAADLGRALTLHAPFDTDFNATFSRGEKTCYYRLGKETVLAQPNDELKLVPGAGRFGGCLHFTKKGKSNPQFKGADVLNYNDKNWSATVSVWLRLDPDKDLAPGYCDPVQIVGDDGKKGFIFLEWSKDETPRYFRYAIRPLIHIWNPTGAQWGDLPAEKRPAVQVARAPFSRDAWTHAVFTVENLNDKSKKPSGKLYLNGQFQGAIEGWDLSLGWDPTKVLLVLGASYVGHLDDLAVFNRPLTDAEVKLLHGLKNGVRELY